MWNNKTVSNTASRNIQPSNYSTPVAPSTTSQVAYPYPTAQSSSSTHTFTYAYPNTAYYPQQPHQHQQQQQIIHPSAPHPFTYSTVPATVNNTGLYGIPSQPAIASIPFQTYMYPTACQYPNHQFAYASTHPQMQATPSPALFVPPPPPPPPAAPPNSIFQINPFQSKKQWSNQRHDRGGRLKSQRTISSSPSKNQIRETQAMSNLKCNTCPPASLSLPSLSCEPCNLQFPSSQSLEAHVASHVTCYFSGCTFTGSRKVVSGHYASVHGKFSGRGLKTVTIQLPGSRLMQRFKICVGNHPEDVKAWIEERKKKFPTRQKVQDTEEKKRKRDEGKSSAEHIPVKRQVVSTPEAVTNREKNTANSPVIQTQPASTQEAERSALSCILLDYGSSSDEEKQKSDLSKSHGKGNKDAEEKFIDLIQPGKETMMQTNVSTQKMFRTRNCKFFVLFGSCKNGDQCNFIHDTEARKDRVAQMEIKRQEQSKRDKARHGLEMDTVSKPIKSKRVVPTNQNNRTLLRKLLENDMRRETILSLQLLRYIVNNNYMQPKKNK